MGVSFTFFFCLLIFSGTSIQDKPPTEAIRESKKLVAFQEEDIAISPSMSSAQLDVPIVNPTTPGGTTNPNPNPTMGSPSPPSTTDPFTNPNPTMGSPSPPSSTTEPITNPTMGSPSPPSTTNPSPYTNPNPTPTNNPEGPSTGGAWCVASPTASPTALQVALDYACGFGGADCSTIQPGASCYEPNTVKDHASYAFNDYYQKNPVPTSCDFGGSAQLTYTDPSSGSCHYASAKPTPTTPPAMPPPSMMTPINPYPPGGQNGYGSEPTDYGAEPTGTPSGADNLSSNIQLLFGMASFVMALSVTHL